jgi:hypothetical protein
MPETYVTPLGTLSWPHLFEPKSVTPGGEPRFSATLILDAAAQKDPLWTAIRQGVAAAIDKKWGVGKCKDAAFVRSLLLPWKPASNKSQYAGFDAPGAVYINPWSKTKPGVYNRRVQPILDPNDVWAGQMVKMSITIFAYHQSANRGVSCNLNNVQIIRTDTPRIDGRSNTGAEFSPEGPEDDDAFGIPFPGATPASPFGKQDEEMPFMKTWR